MKGNRAIPRRQADRGSFILRRMGVLLGVLLLPLLLGAWQDITGNTINPRYVERIKDGQTSRHEILLWFGDPKEVERNPEGPVFKYYSYKDAPVEPSRKDREISDQSAVPSTPYFLDENKQVKKVVTKKSGKILHSTLTVRFKPDGETVMSHEYQEK